MSETMFVALLNSIALLGSKDNPTRQEVVTYNHLLEYAGTIARFNRLLVEEEIEKRLDATAAHNDPDRDQSPDRDTDRGRSASRVA